MLKSPSSKKSHTVAETSHHLKIISIVLIVIGLFFSLLTFVYMAPAQAAAGRGMQSKPYHMLIVNTTLASILVIMEFYKTTHKAVMSLKLGVMLSLVGTIGYMIYLLRTGSDVAPWRFAGGGVGPGDPADQVAYTFGCLATGFIGAGALFSFIYNFHNVAHKY
jgi:preprotein translocase subunit Sss1